MRVAQNRVHVVPSGADLTIGDGVLALVRRQRTGRLHLPGLVSDLGSSCPAGLATSPSGRGKYGRVCLFCWTRSSG